MASLRNQPYMAVYVQDFLTDERLMLCSAASVGVYIKFMLVLTKQQNYGVFSLKEYEKKTKDQMQNFARKLDKFLPFGIEVIYEALNELVTEGVLTLDGDRIFQKRMVKDFDISEKRSKVGKAGGLKTQEKNRSGGGPLDGTLFVPLDQVEAFITGDRQDFKAELIDALVQDFNLTEHKYANHQKTVMQFVNLLDSEGMMDHFVEQYKAYKLYKAESGEIESTWMSLIGAGTKAATWNDRNWTAELERIRNKPGKPAAESKMKTTASVFGGLKK